MEEIEHLDGLVLVVADPEVARAAAIGLRAALPARRGRPAWLAERLEVVTALLMLADGRSGAARRRALRAARDEYCDIRAPLRRLLKQ